jgi:isopentenyl-diphosphate Delta-isomerase
MAHRIVSSEREQLILVDANDREIGSLDKAACHDDAGVLHRAFSLFIFDSRGELLLQQRSADKRLWPLYWSNSCCSHPRLGETMEEATARRLNDELHVAAELEFVYKFAYEARFDAAGSENELCWVYLGRTRDTVVANKNEIAATRTLPAAALDAELAGQPGRFTPWFRMEWRRLREQYAETLQRYLEPPL